MSGPSFLSGSICPRSSSGLSSRLQRRIIYIMLNRICVSGTGYASAITSVSVCCNKCRCRLSITSQQLCRDSGLPTLRPRKRIDQLRPAIPCQNRMTDDRSIFMTVRSMARSYVSRTITDFRRLKMMLELFPGENGSFDSFWGPGALEETLFCPVPRFVDRLRPDFTWNPFRPFHLEENKSIRAADPFFLCAPRN